MAFNPLHSFQRNKRFWMAAILMICMVSFVFCTGMKGDMSERISDWFGSRKRGEAWVHLNNRTLYRRDFDELKTQRNLANDFMRACADITFKKLSKKFFEDSKDDKKAEEQNAQAHEQNLVRLTNMRSTVNFRKSKPRYFDIDVKFDDLVEFKLWQAEADRLGIAIEKDDLDRLFQMEFYGVLDEEDKNIAQRNAMRNVREATDAYVRRAVAEEFRVRIAQYAVLGSQPYSYHVRRQRDAGPGFSYKFAMPDMPDETRAPLTLAQVWDQFKAQRASFDVSLIPVHVQNFTKNVEEPNLVDRAEFFNRHASKAYDPTSPDWSPETPTHMKAEFVYANMPAYVTKAKTIAKLRLASLKMANPVALDGILSEFHSVLLTGLRNEVVAQNHLDVLQRHFDQVSKQRNKTYLHGAALYSEPDCAAPILAYMAGRHPQAVASLIGAYAFGASSGLESVNAAPGFLAWGTTKSPLEGKTEVRTDKTKILTKLQTNDEELNAALQAEMKRRAPVYAKFLAAMPTASQFALELAVPYLAMDDDKSGKVNKTEADGKPATDLFGKPVFESVYIRPLYTVETVQQELEDLLARRTAEEWAQENILIVKQALEKAAGDGEKFKRELNLYVKKLDLVYGPENKAEYYNRFTIDKADDFSVLKESYKKYSHMINLFEARDLTPERSLKPDDFSRMFFENTEKFSVASSLFRAMPWPPEVEPNNTRDVQFLNPRLRMNVANEDLEKLKSHVNQHDPNRQAPNLQLYRTAEQPILFWRTEEIPAHRPSDYKQIDIDLKKYAAERAKIEEELAKKPKGATRIEELLKKQADLKKKDADLRQIQSSITEGYKFERAREKALPEAKAIALNLIKNANNPAVIVEEANKLSKTVIDLRKLSLMHPDEVGSSVDYAPPPLPKDQMVYPRDDMMKQILSLYDMKGPLKIADAASKTTDPLDDINKELFEEAKKEKKPDRFVQIITNKPRTIFYIAAITFPPKVEKELFSATMQGAPFPRIPNQRRDYFVDRVQEQEARRFRQETILWLRETHNYSLDNQSARSEFDERIEGH